MSAVSHTVQVGLFIFLVTFALVLVLETVGEDALAAVLSGNQLLAVIAAAVVGLVWVACVGGLVFAALGM